MKKLLCFILTMASVLSMAVMPASAATINLTDDFESYEVGTVLDKRTGLLTSNATAVQGTVREETNDNVKNQYLEIPAGTYVTNSFLDAGVTKLSMRIKVDETTNAQVIIRTKADYRFFDISGDSILFMPLDANQKVTIAKSAGEEWYILTALIDTKANNMYVTLTSEKDATKTYSGLLTDGNASEGAHLRVKVDDTAGKVGIDDLYEENVEYVLDEDFEAVTDANQLTYPGELVDAENNKAKLEIGSETVSTETNKFLKMSNGSPENAVAAQNFISNGFLKEGKTLLSMRIRPVQTSYMTLRSSVSAQLVLLNFDGANIRLQNQNTDGNRLAYNGNQWFRFNAVLDTNAKTIFATLTNELTGDTVTNTIDYSTNDYANVIVKGAHLRVTFSDLNGNLYVDDLYEAGADAIPYLRYEDFEQHAEGKVAANQFSKRTGLQTANKTSEIVKENGNTYVKAVDGDILHGLPLFADKTVYEFDLKVTGNAGDAWLYLYQNSSNIVDVIRYMKSNLEGEPTVKIGTKYTVGANVDAITKDWARVSLVIDRTANTCDVYFNGTYYSTIAGLMGATEIRAEVNRDPNSGTEGAFCIDNITAYAPFDTSFAVSFTRDNAPLETLSAGDVTVNAKVANQVSDWNGTIFLCTYVGNKLNTVAPVIGTDTLSSTVAVGDSDMIKVFALESLGTLKPVGNAVSLTAAGIN